MDHTAQHATPVMDRASHGARLDCLAIVSEGPNDSLPDKTRIVFRDRDRAFSTRANSPRSRVVGRFDSHVSPVPDAINRIPLPLRQRRLMWTAPTIATRAALVPTADCRGLPSGGTSPHHFVRPDRLAMASAVTLVAETSTLRALAAERDSSFPTPASPCRRRAITDPPQRSRNRHQHRGVAHSPPFPATCSKAACRDEKPRLSLAQKFARIHPGRSGAPPRAKTPLPAWDEIRWTPRWSFPRSRAGA